MGQNRVYSAQLEILLHRRELFLIQFGYTKILIKTKLVRIGHHLHLK